MAFPVPPAVPTAGPTAGTRCSRRASRPVLEALEGRQLLSAAAAAAVGDAPDVAGPQLASVHLIGPNKAVTGVVLTFNEALDPATAEDLKAYVVLKKYVIKGEQGFSTAFFDTSTSDQAAVRTLRFDSAAYDEATQSVTLTPHAAFRADKRFRQLRVAGQGNHAIRDLAGNPLDGGADGRSGRNALIKFHDRRSKKLNLKDADGDRMSLRLAGPGRIVSLTFRKANPTPIILLEGTDPAASVLTGTVKRGKRGDGVFAIEQITGTTAAQVTFLADPAFTIGFTQP